MPGFTESSITLNFPDTNYFRFADCNGYKQLSGNSFKEMDACWLDVSNNLYWLIELKDFSLANLETPETIDQKTWDIVKKSVDSLLMFLSSKHKYTYASNINPCLPIPHPNDSTQFRFVIIIHCDEKQKYSIQLINEKFKNKFRPYALLFGIKNYAVIEHSRAIIHIPNNMIQ